MSHYIFKRVASCLLMIFIASIAIFLALEVLPGSAAQVLAGSDATPDVVAAIAQELGLDRPLKTQYFDWISGIPQLNLGNSYVYGSAVSGLIGERLLVTAPLAIFAMLLSLLLSIPTGIYAATHQGKRRDNLIAILSELGIAIPGFWLAILLILFFAVSLQWFPFGGFPGWNVAEGGGVFVSLRSLVLPVLALAAAQTAILTRFIRSAVLDSIHEKYVQAVRAKGVSRHKTLWKHVLKNASIPILTLVGLQFATLLAGAIVTENVFVLPGLGRLIMTSIENRDLIVIRNILLLLTATVMLVNVLVDCLCMLIDPRHERLE